jgi:hypothetical protein
MKFAFIFALGVVVAGLAGQPVLAQRHAFDRPVTSPYLQLLEPRGDTFAGTYFRRVLPELEWRQRTQSLAQGLERLEGQLMANRQFMQSATSGLRPTGHVASFGPNSRYFPR